MRSALPVLLVVASCAASRDDTAPPPAPERPPVAEPPAPRRQPVAFEAVVVVERTGPRPTFLLRAVSPVMEFDPSDRFWLERDRAASFRVTLQDEEDGLFAFEACDASERHVRFEAGERVILSRIGRIPGLDDDAHPKPGASDVAPWPSPRTR